MMSRQSTLIAVMGVLFALAIPIAARDDRQAAASAQASAPGPVAQRAVTTVPATTIDYNWDVRPILSDYCFRCHGPDERARRAGLRLDQRESAVAQRPGPQPRFAIVPGRPDDSELIRRVTHANVAIRMPPSVTNKVLGAEQIETLRQWIAEGAEYKPHWAYLSPAKSAVPPLVSASRARNDIDRFIVSRLQREGIGLSSEADKETLINRVTLTLTGLPPTLAEVDAFLKDGECERVRQAGRSPAGLPGLRGAHGRVLAEYRSLCRERRVSRRPARSAVLAVSRLGHLGV